MDRREFLGRAGVLLALLGTGAVAIGCGEDEGGTGPGTDPLADEEGMATGSGHSHTGTITGAQLQAGGAVTVTFSGSGHTHQLDLTAGEVEAIAAGTRVEKDQTDSHQHTYVFNA